jgi:hypothetical protein
VFGSFCSHLFHKGSDLDLTITGRWRNRHGDLLEMVSHVQSCSENPPCSPIMMRRLHLEQPVVTGRLCWGASRAAGSNTSELLLGDVFWCCKCLCCWCCCPLACLQHRVSSADLADMLLLLLLLMLLLLLLLLPKPNACSTA